MASTRGGALRANRSTGFLGRGAGRLAGTRVRRVLVVGTLALTPLAGTLAAVSSGAPAGATGTPVIAETFTNTNVSSPGSWVRPPGPEGSANSACLTAGTATSQTPIPDCSASGGDGAGSGVLELTGTANQQEGGVLTSLSVPASNGLDATFDTYQFGGSGADGIGFVIAAEDPSDPVGPTQIGQPGGDLGYSAGAGLTGSDGLADGYLGVGFDVYGNYSAPDFDGSGCTDPGWVTGANPGQVVVRGPGNGTSGYCLLDSSAHELGGTQQLMGSSRSGSIVPVEVVLNTTSAPMTMSGSQFTSDSVPAGDYGVAWVPIAGSAEFYSGPLPSTTNGGIPSGLYPASWINPAGIPYQLGFGWVGSTGGSTDYHEVSNVSVTSLQQVPVLSAAITDNDNGQLSAGGSVDYTLQAGVTATGGNESDPITMTATLPSGVTPGSATGTGWTCSTAGQIVTCTYAGPVAEGTTAPPVSLPASVGSGIAENTPLDSSVTVSSDNGDPATASDKATLFAPPSLTSVTLSATATSNPSAGSPSTPAGIGTIGLDDNGNLPTVAEQDSTGSSASGSPNAAVASTKMNGVKINGVKINGVKINGVKINGVKMNGVDLSGIALGSQAQDTTSLSNDLLSNIGVTYPDGCAGSTCTDWQGILAGSKYAGFPLQSVSLEDVLTADTGSDSPDMSNPAARFNALPLSDVDISGSSLGSLPVAAYALGATTSIDDVPLNSADIGNPTQTLTDWCSDLNSVHWPCSDFGITSDSDLADAANVSVLSLGIAGVPLASIPLDTIPLQAKTVDSSPIAGLSLSGTNLNDTGLGTVKINGVDIGALALGTAPIDEVKMNGVPLGETPLEDLKMNGVNLGTLELGDLPLQGTGLGGIKMNGVPLDELALGTVKINGVKMNGVALGGLLLSSLSNLDSVVDCTDFPTVCSTPGETLAEAQQAGAILPGADLQTLQAGITEPNAAWDATTLADVDGSDSSDPGADQTTLADLVTLAGSDSAFAQVFKVAVLSDVSGSDPTTTVAQIEGALTNGATDSTTLAELLSAELVDTGTTIGQLIDQLASSDPSAFNGLYLGDLLSGLVPESSFPWQNVNLATPGLAAASTGGGEVTLTATTVVANGPTALSEVLTVPAGFSLVTGSATFDGQPSPDPTVSGSTLTATPGNSTGTDTYSVEVRPNEVLGSQPVSVTASIAGGNSQSAATSVNITDPFAGNGSPNTPSTLQPDSLNVSFLSAPNVSAYWDINVPAGDGLSLDMSDLPADYDMVLYGQPTTELSSTPTQVTAGVTDTPPGDQSSGGQQDAPDPGTVPLLATLPVEAISANRGLTPEQITTPALPGGTYLVQISGYNGAYSTTAPYALRSQLIQTVNSPSCSVPTTYDNDALNQDVAVPGAGQPLTETWSASGGWSLQAPPANVNTLFLIDPDRLYDAYGQSSADDGHPGANEVLQQLTSTINSGAGGMVGAIVPVEGNTQTAADYHAWDTNACSVQAANKVVSDISATVRSLEAAYPTIANIVIVGADDQIPMGRVPDMTVSDNESDYAASTLPGITDQLSSALSEGYFLSDDPYVSPDPLGVGGQTLYTPSLAIGRLVETPTQIDSALSRFQSSNGELNATSALSTGYDFLTQGADAIAASLSGPLGAAKVQTLIGDSWTKQDLLNAIDGGTTTSPATAPTVDSINAHFDYGRALSALGDTTTDPTTAQNEILSTTEVRADDPSDEIPERLLFSLGCHSGLDIPTNEISNVVPGGVDSWASTFADEGAIWVGNTGYGYANDQYISYSAKLMSLFAQSLNGSVSIGDALSEAKQLYTAQTGVLDPYDLKADMESTYYGMPNYTLSGLAHPSANSATTTPQLSLGQDPATGLQTASVSLNQSTGTSPNQLGTVTPPEGGTYYEVNNSSLEQTTAGFPIEPLSSIDVTIPGANGQLASEAHGALITGLTSTDVGDFTPSIAEADSDTSGPENQISQYETSFPATLQRVATYQLFSASGASVTHQAVDLVTGQFIPDPSNPGTGNQRLFTSVDANVEYTSPSDTNFAPPTIDEATGIVVNGTTADFNVVTTPAPGGSPVKEVLVLFTDTTNAGTWTPVNLTQGAGGVWTGGAPAPTSGKITYIVQAVDGDGNVAMDSDKGVEFNQVPESQVQSTGLGTGLSASLSPVGNDTEVDGFYNGPVDVTFTGAPGATVTYQVDGGASQTVGLGSNGQGSFTLASDGTHVVTASDTGNQIRQAVQIDTTAPTISSSISAPHSGNGWTGGGTTLTISASDAGSGVASLAYQVGTGPVTPVTGPITPPPGVTTYTVTAADFVGNTSTASITTQVDTTAPGSIMCTPAVAPTTWFSTDQSVTCTGTDTQSGIAGGTSTAGSTTLSTSVPAGTSTADASTSSGQLCDNVDNCVTIPPISGFMIDKTLPSISCQAPTGWYASPASFTCTATDAGSGLAPNQTGVTLNGSGSQGTFTLTASEPPGTSSQSASTNSVQICDNVGTCTTAGPITGIEIDNTLPTISTSVTAPHSGNGWTGAGTTLNVSATDAQSGLASLTYQAGTGPATAVPASGSITPPSGITNYTITATDNVGNASTTTLTTQVDTTAPAIATSVTAPHTGNGWTSAGTTLSVSATDAQSGLASLTYQAGTGPVTAVTGPITPPSGITNYTITATDNVGNTSTTTVTTQVDTTAPAISTSVSASHSGNGWTGAGTTLNVSATDAQSGLASLTYQAGTGAVTSVPASGSITPPSGTTTYTITATDKVGNTSTSTVTTQVDTTAPTISSSVSAPHSGNGWTSGGTTLNVSATDAQSGLASLTYQAGTGPVTSVPASGSITPPSGATTYTITATDKVGNTSTSTVTTKVDSTVPAVSCAAPAAGWHTGTVSVPCTATDAQSGLATTSQASFALSASIAAGTSNANASTNSVQVCDNVDNCTQAGPYTGIEIDNTSPTISIINPTNNAVYMLNQPEVATYSCADAVSGIASCSAVTGTTTLSSGATLPTTQVGSHAITVTAKSKAGVTTTQTYTYVVTYKICNFAGPIEPLGVAVAFSVTLCNYSGTNVGSSSLAITPLNIDGTTAPKPATGKTFTWSSALKVYAYGMLTSGLSKGNHVLNVSVTGDPETHALAFTLK